MILLLSSAYQAKYKSSPKGKETQRRYRQSMARKLAKQREYVKDYEKILVRVNTQHAKSRGEIVSLPCAVCNEPKVHAHHDDYSKRLDIIWLCALHHRERHQFIDLFQEVKHRE